MVDRNLSCSTILKLNSMIANERFQSERRFRIERERERERGKSGEADIRFIYKEIIEDAFCTSKHGYTMAVDFETKIFF